jgi:hypothetical protein
VRNLSGVEALKRDGNRRVNGEGLGHTPSTSASVPTTVSRRIEDVDAVLLQNPVKWRGKEPSDDQKQVIFDTFADAIARRMLKLATNRVWMERGREWQNAYDKRGTGSSYVRADIIGTQILDPAAPVPNLTPSIDRNEFLHEVAAGVKEAADECGAVLE